MRSAECTLDDKQFMLWSLSQLNVVLQKEVISHLSLATLGCEKPRYLDSHSIRVAPCRGYICSHFTFMRE